MAGREGLAGVTVRAVAAEAHVSHGLVLFHFGRREQLVQELLDWLIHGMAGLRICEDIARFPRAIDRLHALLQQEIERLARHPEQTRLFLEFWAMGAQDETILTRIRAEVGRYRAAFLAIFEEILHSESHTAPTATAAGLAAVAVSWIQGCAVQSLIDPERFDTEEYLSAVRAVIDESLGRGSAPAHPLALTVA